MDAPGRQTPCLKGVNVGQTLMQDQGRNVQGNRHTDTLNSGPSRTDTEKPGGLFGQRWLPACQWRTGARQWSAQRGAARWGWGGRPLRSVQREMAGCPELPDASRRDACEVIEGLRVCAWWDMWGGVPPPLGGGVGAPRSKEQRQVKSSLGQRGARAPELDLEKDF